MDEVGIHDLFKMWTLRKAAGPLLLVTPQEETAYVERLPYATSSCLVSRGYQWPPSPMTSFIIHSSSINERLIGALGTTFLFSFSFLFVVVVVASPQQRRTKNLKNDIPLWPGNTIFI